MLSLIDPAAAGFCGNRIINYASVVAVVLLMTCVGESGVVSTVVAVRFDQFMVSSCVPCYVASRSPTAKWLPLNCECFGGRSVAGQ